MNPFWSNYRRLWMIAANTIIDSQKFLLAQTKWLLSEARSGEAQLPTTAGATGRVAGPARAAAQAADEHREERTSSAAASKRSPGQERTGRTARPRSQTARRRHRRGA